MARSIRLLCMLLLVLSPLTAYSATVTGYLLKDDSPDPIQHGFVQALGDSGPTGAEGHVDEDGQFSFEIDPGTYNFEAVPYTDSPDQSYIVTIVGPHTILNSGDTLNLGDIYLSRGGNISGTIQRSFDGGSWYNYNINVLDQNGQWVTWGTVDGTAVNPDDDLGNPNPEYDPLEISYMTQAVPEGSYYLQITDQTGQFHDVFYDNLPSWTVWDGEGATPISVINETSTNGIDFSLTDASEESYFIKAFDPYTAFISTPETNSTQSGAYYELGRFSGGKPVHPDQVSSVSLTAPGIGPFTNSTGEIYALWRLSYTDENRDGLIINATEESPPYALTYTEQRIDFATGLPHPAGNYTLEVGLKNGTTLTKTFSDLPAGIELQPVTNLSAYYDYQNQELYTEWTIPSVYPGDCSIELRINLFHGGQFINNQIRIRELPADTTSFTFNEDMTFVFNTGRADQIGIEVRVRSDGGTIAKTTRYYSFNAATGELTPAPIGAVFDINGDGRTGLEETIYSLQVITNQ